MKTVPALCPARRLKIRAIAQLYWQYVMVKMGLKPTEEAPAAAQRKILVILVSGSFSDKHATINYNLSVFFFSGLKMNRECK